MDAAIRKNNVRVYVAMAILTAVIGILGTAISYFFDWGLTGTSVFIIVAGIINFVAYFFSDRIILRSTGAKPLARDIAPEVYEVVENLCAKANLPMPKIYFIEERTMNAFATGRNHAHSAVAVTRGLLERMTRDEVEGVLSHELDRACSSRETRAMHTPRQEVTGGRDGPRGGGSRQSSSEFGLQPERHAPAGPDRADYPHNCAVFRSIICINKGV